MLQSAMPGDECAAGAPALARCKLLHVDSAGLQLFAAANVLLQHCVVLQRLKGGKLAMTPLLHQASTAKGVRAQA